MSRVEITTKVSYRYLMSKSKDDLANIILYLIEENIRRQKDLLNKVKEISASADKLSYCPQDHDVIQNWPIVQEPTYIIAQSIWQDLWDSIDKKL